MKKTLLFLFLAFISAGSLWSQCVPTCSNYAVSPITYTTFPSGSTNVTPTFTNPFYTGPFADDGSIGPIPIGFNFDFFCNTYTDIHICSNGFITFDYQPFSWPTQYVHPTQSLPDAADPNGMIAFNMTDLDPGVGGTINYITVGTAPNRMFIVTYSNVPCFSSSTDLNTGQIVLYETSNIIEIHTASAKPDVNQGTLGSFQGIESTTGAFYAYPPGRNGNNTWGANANNTAYQFSPYTPAPPSTLTGDTLLCEGQVGNYQASFIIGASAYNWTLPSGWTGTSTISALVAGAGASGNLSVTATYTCGTSVATTISVTTNPAPVVGITSYSPVGTICSGETVTFSTSGAVSYTLNPGAIVSSAPTITDIPLGTTMYTLTGTSPMGCISVNNPTVTIPVNQTPIVAVNNGSICLGESFTITPSGANSYVIVGLPFGTATPTAAGQYAYPVIGTSTNGCVADTAFSNLTAYGLPTVVATADRTVMCTKESVKLTATGANTYLWSNGSSNPTITVSPATNTLFTVTGTNAEGCKNEETILLSVKPCTGLNELSGGVSGVKIFPNPTNGMFEIQLNYFDETTSVEIYNALGQQIIVEKVNSEIMAINLKEFNNGLYYVKIKSKNNEQESQLIKVIKQ